MIVRIFKCYPLTCCCIILTWYLCLFRPPQIKLGDIAEADKILHLLMYFGTCSIMWGEYWRNHTIINWTKVAIFAIILPIAMSGIIELAQAYLTTYRSGDVADFLANTAGVLLAIPIGYFLAPRFTKRFK